MTTSCVEFTGPRCPKGYGYAWVGDVGKKVRMHRWAYVQAHGIPLSAIEGQVVLHTCDNPPCVNPAHLRIGTQADNVQDMITKGRDRKATGPDNRMTKLSDEDVRSIRRRYVRGSRHCNLVTLGKEYGVYPSTIAAVVHNRHHRDTEEKS